MAKLSTIEGIGPAIEKKLNGAGIRSVEGLLKACSTKKGRKDVSGTTGIDDAKLLKFANHADLMRIRGVGGEFSELLEAAGVDSTKELSRRKAENLAAKMVEINTKKKLVRQLPSVSQLQTWIDQAGSLDKVVTH